MRLIGNKTHGDLAEIAISEFINQYMYDFNSIHVGKDLYRSKSKEEDIVIVRETDKAKFPVSLKAYGNGPLQLSTDKSFKMFPRIEKESDPIIDKIIIEKILQDPAFEEGLGEINILPLIYVEGKNCCQIMVFDYYRAVKETSKIVRVNPGVGRRKYPVYIFPGIKF